LAAAEECAVADWDVRVRALELLAAAYGLPPLAVLPPGTSDGDEASSGELAPPLAGAAAVQLALAVCTSALEDGKFVEVRKAGVRSLRALVAGTPAAHRGPLKTAAIQALDEAVAREKDSATSVLLTTARAEVEAAASQEP